MGVAFAARRGRALAAGFPGIVVPRLARAFALRALGRWGRVLGRLPKTLGSSLSDLSVALGGLMRRHHRA